MNINLKSLRKANREIELEMIRKHGPQHTKGGLHQSNRDKARSPRLQRKNRGWLKMD